METTNDTLSNAQENQTLKLENDTLSHIFEISKWTGFFAILGFVFLGLLLLMAFFFSAIFSSISNEIPFPPFIFSIFYILLGILYFFPVLYLYRFSNYAKKALFNKNTTELNLAFSNLKSHFRFVGIVTIVILGIYALVLIGAVVGSMFF